MSSKEKSFTYFESALTVLRAAHLPDVEIRWFVATAWNNAVFFARIQRGEASARWSVLATKLVTLMTNAKDSAALDKQMKSSLEKMKKMSAFEV